MGPEASAIHRLQIEILREYSCAASNLSGLWNLRSFGHAPRVHHARYARRVVLVRSFDGHWLRVRGHGGATHGVGGSTRRLVLLREKDEGEIHSDNGEDRD